jgi:cysteine-rich repeat protein
VVCGNGIIQTGEECDDDNATSGDGCSSDCQFEDKLCMEGKEASVSRQAKRVAFASDYDYVGTNADGNEEIFLFERKEFDKALKKKMKRPPHPDLATAKAELLATSAGLYFFQLTETVSPALSAFPSLNGSGRIAAFVSTGDLVPGAPGNTDGNLEIYRRDIKRMTTVQVTDSGPSVDNLNPNLRAFRGNLLAFDSNGDLVADRCVGGENAGEACSDAEWGRWRARGEPRGIVPSDHSGGRRRVAGQLTSDRTWTTARWGH